MGMTNAVEQECWTEITVTVATADIETAGNIANMVVPYGIYIEDYSALEEETMEIAHIDLIEESLLQKDRTNGIIHIYVNPNENPLEAVAFIKDRLDDANIKYEIKIQDCRVEDWQNNWKQYFHPMPIGEKLLIRPIWEDNYDAGDRKVLNIEPGLAFGTGSHPTTKLCLETLEKYVNPDTTVLDIGCGSGILSIVSLLLGAKDAAALDIDPNCVHIAYENAGLNGIYEDKYTVLSGNVLSDDALFAKISHKKYDVVEANIIADVIIALAPKAKQLVKNGGTFVTSGIIINRADEVEETLGKYFKIEKIKQSGEWISIVCRNY